MLLVLLLGAAGLILRLTYWQVVEHSWLSVKQAAQLAQLTDQPPQRGLIYDDSGLVLATDITANQVYAVPDKIRDPKTVATALAPLVHRPLATLEDELSGNAPYPLLIADNVSNTGANGVIKLAFPGIIVGTQPRRAYPDGSLASQVLGYANRDNQGNYGLEGFYDRFLSGQAGVRAMLRDTAGGNIQLNAGATVAPQNGADLHLTLDSAIQGLAEDELQKAVKAHSADGGTVIVMDPRTGAILAMAGNPTYDPNTYPQTAASHPERFTNPAIQWDYEPGSTLKILTMAAGLDSGVITPQSSLYDTGAFQVGNVTLHNWNMGGFGEENMTQVLQHSANVGAAWVANRLGTTTFYAYMHRFRVGQPTGVDLQGEQSGLFPQPNTKNWTIVNLYTNAFGQGVAVTPLQLADSVSAIANGGVMMKPQIVREMDYEGRTVVRKPVSLGRVVSARTAATLTDMLVHSAIDGEASASLVKGYDIAAKTGTANVADGHGGYIPNDTVASIIAYAPAYHPRFLALVIIQHPRDTLWGSMAAAPVLKHLFQELFLHYHIPPSPTALNR